MNRIALILCLAAIAGASYAQTPAPKTAASKTTASSTSAKATTVRSTAANADTDAAPWLKLPPNVPRVMHGPVKIAIAARYEDIKVGTGPVGEPDKLWHIKYTGWRAADGVKFDSWDDHPQPVIGADGKPEMGPDGKPKVGEPQPMAFPQGMGRLIPGFDYAVTGMHVGGKRRLFIPWQLAYGMRSIPDRPDHPGIPAKSDLIFDVELVEVTDLPTPPTMPMRPPTGAPGTPPGSVPRPATPPPPTNAPGAASQPSAPPKAATAPAASQPGTTTTESQPK